MYRPIRYVMVMDMQRWRWMNSVKFNKQCGAMPCTHVRTNQVCSVCSFLCWAVYSTILQYRKFVYLLYTEVVLILLFEAVFFPVFENSYRVGGKTVVQRKTNKFVLGWCYFFILLFFGFNFFLCCFSILFIWLWHFVWIAPEGEWAGIRGIHQESHSLDTENL